MKELDQKENLSVINVLIEEWQARVLRWMVSEKIVKSISEGVRILLSQGMDVYFYSPKIDVAIKIPENEKLRTLVKEVRSKYEEKKNGRKVDG